MPKSRPRYVIRRNSHSRYNAADHDAKNHAWQAAQDDDDEDTQKRRRISHINTLDLLAETPADWWQRYMERESEATHAYRDLTLLLLRLIVVLSLLTFIVLSVLFQVVITHI